jgi:uncharacterized protein (DUF1501 family)
VFEASQRSLASAKPAQSEGCMNGTDHGTASAHFALEGRFAPLDVVRA